LLAFGEEKKKDEEFLLHSLLPPSLSVHVVSPAGMASIFLSLSLWLFLIQIRMSRAQCLVRTIVSWKKKVRSLVLESSPFVDSSSHH